MGTTTVPGYASIPLLHVLAFLLSGAGYTAAYFFFIRASHRFRKPCLPSFSLALNISWELALILIMPFTPIGSLVYIQWFITNIALVYSQIRFGGIRVGEFITALAIAGVGELCAMKTIMDLVVGDGMNGGTAEDGRFQAAFWTGYVCQVVISAWSLQQVVRGAGDHLDYGQWLARFLGHLPVAWLTFDRAREKPELYWYATSPMGLFLVIAPIVMDVMWPVVKSVVIQEPHEGISVETRAQMEEKKKA